MAHTHERGGARALVPPAAWFPLPVKKAAVALTARHWLVDYALFGGAEVPLGGREGAAFARELVIGRMTNALTGAAEIAYFEATYVLEDSTATGFDSISRHEVTLLPGAPRGASFAAAESGAACSAIEELLRRDAESYMAWTAA